MLSTSQFNETAPKGSAGNAAAGTSGAGRFAVALVFGDYDAPAEAGTVVSKLRVSTPFVSSLLGAIRSAPQVQVTLVVAKRPKIFDGLFDQAFDGPVLDLTAEEVGSGPAGDAGPDGLEAALARYIEGMLCPAEADGAAAPDGIGSDPLGADLLGPVAALLSPPVAEPAATVAPAATPKRRCSPLPTWRMKRTLAHIEAHLADALPLADLAAAAGLTRMHFAAQFRAATGVPPHEYVLRTRIERAKELLAKTNEALVDVALDVGFQTQAHFTTVFKRFVGETPHRWRRANFADGC